MEPEDLGFGLEAGVGLAGADELGFEGAPEAFYGGVVVAVAASAHGGEQAGGLEGGAEVPGGVSDGAVGVEEQARWRGAVQGRHRKGGGDERGVDGRAHGPAQDLAAVEIHHAGQIEPAFGGGDAGEGGDPDLVGCRGLRTIWGRRDGPWRLSVVWTRWRLFGVHRGPGFS